MADITPVTREEFYLAKAGGQDVPVPSAVTREEYYLEKLTNDSVAVPTPVTRREKFLYFASGGEIDLPSEEKMTRLERLIAKAGGMDVSTPTAVTRLEKFWANVEAGGWKTITGVLPLTFTAKGSTAADWVIYGNDENGTENLCELTIANCGIDGNGTLTSSTAWQMFCAPIVSGEEYTIVSENIVYGFYTSKPEVSSTAYNSTRYAPGGTKRTFTADINGWVAIRLESERSDVTMLVKGSTAPDHYIPYQKGVGERTKNLCGEYLVLSIIGSGGVISSNSHYDIGLAQVEQGETYSFYRFASDVNAIYAFYESKPAIGSTSYNNTRVVSGSLSGSFTAPITGWIAFCIQSNTGQNLTITKGSTPPETYIPYGYQIPIDIKQGETDKNCDIYIGDSPLTEGETVSKTSTGVDIELFNGENTVSTPLYNKPEMMIKYKE